MVKNSLREAVTLACISAALLASPACAQTAQPTLASTAKTPGDILYDHGISLSLSYTGEAAGNPSGGIRQGTDYTGQVYLGADFDLGRILGFQGTTVHVAITDRHGRNLAADYIGNNTSVQEVYGTQNLHLAVFTIEQKLFNDRLDITAGRTVANIAFLNSPYYCVFQSNSTCGNPTFIFKDSNFTYFPASAWGGDARLRFTPNTYIHSGVYEVSPVDKTFLDHGFNWSGKGDTGIITPTELGYTPGNNLYAIGGFYDTGAYSDPLDDVDGQAALAAGQPYAQHHDRSGLFLRFNQDLNDQGLTLFGIFMTRLSGRMQENQFYDVGIVKTGTFSGREQDKVGFVIDDQEFSSLFVQNIEAARDSIGGPGNIPHREIMMELHYLAQVTPTVTLEPNLQYIINPDQSSEPFRTTNIPNAFVIGLKFTVDIGKILGIAPPS
jgi:porin